MEPLVHPPLNALRPEDLPAWMRPRRRGLDYGLLLVLALCLLVAVPLLARESLPRYNDLELHEWRSSQMAALVRDGVLYSRWAPLWTYGYGSPLLNYLAPLSHYVAGVHQAITDTAPVDSVKLLLVSLLFVTGTGMYQFARVRWGTSAGIIAATLYLLSGPVIFGGIYLYGDLPLLMALGILPWAAWSFDQLWLHADRRAWLAALVTLSALLLSDTRVAFLAAAALLPVVISGRRLAGAHSKTAGMRGILSVSLAVACLTAFFWLPVVAERDQVRWLAGQPPAQAGVIPLSESLGPLPASDPQQLNPVIYRGLGMAPWLFALGGLLGFARRRTLPDERIMFLALGAALVLLASPLGASVWPDQSGFQALMPYHAVAVAAFCFAASGSAMAAWERLRLRLWREAALPVFCGMALVMALPAVYPPPWSARPGQPDSALDALQAELQGFHYATLRNGVFLPANLPGMPQPLPNALEVFSADPPDRVNRRALPAEAQMDALEYGPLHGTYIVNTQGSTQVGLNILAAPGWYAQLSEQPVPVTPDADGLIALSLPASNGELTLRYGATPARDLAWMVTLMGLIGGWLMWRASPPTLRSAEQVPLAPDKWSRGALAVLGALLVTAIAFAWWVQSHPEALPPGASRPSLREVANLPRFLQGGVDLLGYELPDSQVAPGETLYLDVFWEAGRPVLENAQSEAYLFDPVTRQRIARTAHRHPGGVPTLRWPLGRFVRDRFALVIPPETPPGAYALQVAMGACASRDPLPCTSVQGMDAYSAAGGVERGGVTIPVIIRVRTP